ncbi:MAG TPA: CPBP family intramembrane glutamic endopeptidase [Candidatus Binatia bacterium]|nr:CPBP family intramembrane glutamic endopeptidase [Candidatus Binatia bacterium]
MTTEPLPLYSAIPLQPSVSSRSRDLIELVLGYGMIVGVIWCPEHIQAVLSPFVLLFTLWIVLRRKPSRDELGVGLRGLAASFWVLPAAIVLTLLSVFIAGRLGTLHPLYKGDFKHIAGYVLWTVYQQFLLQNYFMDRLLRLGWSQTNAVIFAGTLFAVAHLPSPYLTAATLVWGIVSCALFRRYRNLWVLGLAQGLLGLCFAMVVPDVLHHHLRVGLGYLRYSPAPLSPAATALKP